LQKRHAKHFGCEQRLEIDETFAVWALIQIKKSARPNDVDRDRAPSNKIMQALFLININVKLAPGRRLRAVRGAPAREDGDSGKLLKIQKSQR